MDCICSIRTSHQDSPAFISGSVYEVKQHVSQWLRENRSVLVCERQNSPACFSGRQSELGVPKWGQQWLLCHAVSQSYQVRVIFHELANTENFKCWASSEEILVHDVCLHICWVVVQKSGCFKESIHLFHRRNWGNKEMHGKGLESEQVFKVFYGEIKHKRKKKSNIPGLTPWSTRAQLFCSVLCNSFIFRVFCFHVSYWGFLGHLDMSLTVTTFHPAEHTPVLTGYQMLDKTFSHTSCCPEGCCSTKELARWRSFLMFIHWTHIKFTHL